MIRGVTRRNYGQACSLATALDQIGERWALLVVRELSLGPLRFSDLGRAVGGAPPDVLTRRLRDLEEAGIIERREAGPPVSGTVYELTAIGRELERPMIELGRWGMHFYSAEEAREVTATTLPNALRVVLQPPPEADFTLGLRSEGQSFRLRIADGEIEAARADVDGADVILSGGAADVLAHIAVPGGGGPVEVEGDFALVDQLRGMVRLPERLRAEVEAATARSA